MRRVDERDVLRRLVDREPHERMLGLEREVEHEGRAPTEVMVAADPSKPRQMRRRVRGEYPVAGVGIAAASPA